MYFSNPFAAYLPIITSLQLYFTSGMKANGRRKESMALTTLTMRLSCPGNSTEHITGGSIATNRVIIARVLTGSFKFKKPSMTY
mmetsp:Transcript_15014/g.22506  ORF Transcript_15014/g.22506 Transcript_15014/m.22506 type:complete len:84 (-) Transcript_15014:1128-1379(-)